MNTNIFLCIINHNFCGIRKSSDLVKRIYVCALQRNLITIHKWVIRQSSSSSLLVLFRFSGHIFWSRINWGHKVCWKIRVRSLFMIKLGMLHTHSKHHLNVYNISFFDIHIHSYCVRVSVHVLLNMSTAGILWPFMISENFKIIQEPE